MLRDYPFRIGTPLDEIERRAIQETLPIHRRRQETSGSAAWDRHTNHLSKARQLNLICHFVILVVLGGHI